MQTTVGLYLLRACGLRPIWYGTAPELSGQYVGQTEEKIAALFRACQDTPNLICCIVIDEVDTLTAKRTSVRCHEAASPTKQVC